MEAFAVIKWTSIITLCPGIYHRARGNSDMGSTLDDYQGSALALDM